MKPGMIIDDISSLKPGEEKTPPIFLHFLHASSRPEDIVNSNVKINVEVNAHKNAKPTFNLELQTPNLSYVTADHSEDQYFDTYIAIRDKASGKTRLVEAINMSLKPKVIPPRSSNPVLLAEDKNEGEESTEPYSPEEQATRNLAKKKALTLQFGQKSKQSHLSKMDREIVDAADTEERVKKALGDVKEMDIMSPQVTEEVVDLIPPRDELAPNPSDIYRIEHVLTEKEIVDLTASCLGILNTYDTSESIDKAVDQKILQPIGGYYLKTLVAKKEKIAEAGKDDKAALVVYLDTLCFFLRVGRYQNRMVKGCRMFHKHVPFSIMTKILDNFSSGQKESRMFTPKLRHKAVCHAIVLGLIIGRGNIDFKIITESIYVDHQILPKLVSVTGAYLEKDKATGEHRIIMKNKLASFDLTLDVDRKRKPKRQFNN